MITVQENRERPRAAGGTHVLLPELVAVAGHVAAAVARDLARRVRERVPDALPPTILVPPALNLVGRCCGWVRAVR